MFRFPEAKPVQADGGGWVECVGPAEQVLPRGVHPDPGFEDSATRLTATLHEIAEHLRQVATYSGDEAASQLVEHVRTFGGPFLCVHGLPMWHEDRPAEGGQSCRYPGVPGSKGKGPGAVSVAAVQRMVSTLDAVRTMHDLLVRRQRIRPALVEDVLGWPVLPSYLSDIARAEPKRDGFLWTGRGRQLVGRVLDSAMSASGLRASVVWRRGSRPELALVAGTATALYIADAVAHVSGFDDDRTFICSVCGLPFTPQRAPRAGDALYCRRAECQRTRQRINQARWRARTKGE